MKKIRKGKAVTTVPFDAADYLRDDEIQLAYLNAVLAEGDAQALVAALGTVARARGMSRVAKGQVSVAKAFTRPSARTGIPPSRRSSTSPRRWGMRSRCVRLREPVSSR